MVVVVGGWRWWWEVVEVGGLCEEGGGLRWVQVGIELGVLG